MIKSTLYVIQYDKYDGCGDYYSVRSVAIAKDDQDCFNLFKIQYKLFMVDDEYNDEDFAYELQFEIQRAYRFELANKQKSRIVWLEL